MARLRIFKSIDNHLYTINFVNDAQFLSSEDKNAMQKFGEPEINLGGTFLVNTVNQFSLVDYFVRVRSDFPQKVTFDDRDSSFSTNIEDKVNGYIDEIVDRFQAAFADLRSKSDGFTGEQVEEI
jgi:hypothetical protein